MNTGREKEKKTHRKRDKFKVGVLLKINGLHVRKKPRTRHYARVNSNNTNVTGKKKEENKNKHKVNNT